METPITDITAADEVTALPPNRQAQFCPQSALYFYIYTLMDTPLTVIGLVGNLLALKVLKMEKKLSATVFLLRCLAVADILLLIFMVPLTYSFAMDYLGIKVSLVFRETKMIATAYLQPVVIVCHMTTTWFTVIVTWYRYLAVCKPLTNQATPLRRTKIHLALTSCFIVVFNIPRFFEAKLFQDESGIKLRFTALVEHPVYNYLYKVVLYNTLMYVIPVVSLIYFTIKLVQALAELKKKRKSMMSKQTSKSAREDLTLSLVVVVIVFITCQLFNPIRRIIAAAQEESLFTCGKPYYLIIPITACAMIVNSSANFVIYTLCVPRFRQNLVGLFRRLDGTVLPNSVDTQQSAMAN